jgi:hypothetical protein
VARSDCAVDFGVAGRGQRPKFGDPDRPLCRVARAAFSSTEKGDPPHAEVRIEDPGQDASGVWPARPKSSSTLLVAEAYWAECFPPPSPEEVTEWMLTVVPTTLLLHFGMRMRRAVRRFARSDGLKAKLAAGCECVWAGVLLLLAVGLLVPVLLNLLFFLTLLRFLPIPLLPDAILKKVQSVLAEIIGDSMVFCASPARLAAIVREARAAMDWLEAQCERVAIIAHSQGAAVLRHAMGGGEGEMPPPENLCGIVTLGAGLRKLEVLLRLEAARGTSDLEDRFLHLMIGKLAQAITIFALIELALHMAGIVFSWALFVVFALLVGLNLLLFALIDFERKTPVESWWKQIRNCRPSAEWLDLFASRDPVSNGPMWEDAGPEGAVTAKVTNRSSVIFDHTAYWENDSGFVSRVAAFLARVGGLDVPLHELLPGDAARIEREAKMRRVRVLVVRAAWWVVPAILVVVWSTDSGEVSRFGEGVRDHVISTLLWLEADPNWGFVKSLQAAQGRTLAAVFCAILLGFWTLACGWTRNTWNSWGSATLAQHLEVDLINEIFAIMFVLIFAFLFWMFIADQFGSLVFW